jgi:hypothetical protein
LTVEGPRYWAADPRISGSSQANIFCKIERRCNISGSSEILINTSLVVEWTRQRTSNPDFSSSSPRAEFSRVAEKWKTDGDSGQRGRRD